MKDNLKLLLITLFFIFGPKLGFSQGLNSNELISQGQQYDGKSIIYSGEAIGEVMKRGEFAWVNINDGNKAIGVWMSAGLAKEINFTGAYKAQGDIVEIIGVFHRACLEHGGDLDIHARALRKITPGKITDHKLDSFKVKVILGLLGALFLVWILSLFKRK
ncbi:MAG: DNA-binding protein [Candidatus Omnitrophica bacterium CG11_big_fil_rev_8_21_14_0_20_41_12]|nr:MAG: DNA-binding protein [Candidatus Omnitrophica bacterium CG11_big_fil_rev_8_21_14_0_20_41_12]